MPEELLALRITCKGFHDINLEYFEIIEMFPILFEFLQHNISEFFLLLR